MENTGDWLHSCENCAALDGDGHYCLLHSETIKNADIITCPDWKEQEE